MLRTLRIKNLALVPDLTLELAPGYNVISGETGAGKSIIIGALNLLLGERADRTLIRAGEESCTVEAAFDISCRGERISAILEEKGLECCENGELLLKRSFSTGGVNKQFVNGSPTTLGVLGEIGQWLVDMHGPHDHQSLLHNQHQLGILDAFGGLNPQRAGFRALLEKRSALLREKAALIVDERTYAQQLDLLRFQVKEISSAKLTHDEEAQIESEYARASNSARLTELAQSALSALSEEENSLLSVGGAVGRSLQELARLDNEGQALLDLHEQATALFQDLQRELSRYADSIDVDPARLHELEQRLSLLQTLKRKYGPTLADVIRFGNEAQERLRSLESRDAELERIQSALSKVEQEIARAGKDLTSARQKTIPKLARAVIKQLSDLGFKQSSFQVELRTLPPQDFFAREHAAASGLDTAEFQFAPNPGEPSRPLKAIASSGELARVMLALKTALAAEDEIPVLVFDEVDANVGGETASAVGAKMKQIGLQRQVLCITHLPQVAAAADHHFVVTKIVKDGRTVSAIESVSGKTRAGEIARMLGGGDAARKHAESLLKPSNS